MKRLNELKKQKLYEMVAEELMDYVITNRLKPGEQLPTEMQLVDMLKVGRSSIREGIRHLYTLGIVESHNKKGIIVKEPDLTPMRDYMQFHMQRRGAGKKELSEAAMCIYLGIIPLVMKNLNDDYIKGLNNIINEWRNNNKSTEDIIKYDFLFHETLIKITGNEVLKEYTEILREFFNRKKGSFEHKADEILNLHTTILQCLKERDLGKTINSMLCHNNHYSVDAENH